MELEATKEEGKKEEERNAQMGQQERGRRVYGYHLGIELVWGEAVTKVGSWEMTKVGSDKRVCYGSLI